jgi:general secretion pathway protein A
MYLSHFSLNERPFSISPDPRFLFMSNRYREALAHLTYGVEDGGGFVLLTGEVGTGKTTVCRCLLQQLPDKTRLAFVLNPKLNSLELLATICDELKIDYPENCNSLKILTDKLSQYLLSCYEQDLSVVVMIDEAQNIATEVLEQIRLLTNLETNQKKLLQIILVGQPELQEKLAQRELRQLAQRITARYHLRPLNLKETMAYVLHRIRIAGSRKGLFTRKSIELLHAKTSGIPRLINTICDRALLATASRKKNLVNYRIMRDAIRDVMGVTAHSTNLKSRAKNNWLKWGVAGVSVALFFVLSFWLGQISNETIKTEVVEHKAANEEITSQQSIESGRLEKTTQQPDEAKGNKNNKQQSPENLSISLLEKLLANERWDLNGNWSMQQLMALWQVDYSPLSDGSGCDFAASYGLVCRTVQGNWLQLRQFNRPAILKFSAGLQGEFWGTLKSLSGLDATLIFGEREVTVRIDELSTIWTGEYQLLWQAPSGYSGDMRLGDQGEAIVWLSDKMKQLVDTQLSASQDFSGPLYKALKTYQSQRNINADGIAGMQTILTINGETLVGIPQLQKY